MDIYEDVIKRLCGFGYHPKGSMHAVIELAINNAGERIKAETNRDEVPEGLRYIWIDMAAGAVLCDLMAAGQLGDDIVFPGEAKRITEGDVTVEMSSGASGADVFRAAIERMASPPKGIFAAFRRLTW